ncbi:MULTISPECIES: asparagine synthetase B family protein [unclassified Microcoleus]|uniref:asparagine synthetase B family protein n=1 Tax=unclassified Microcoleus TaxID=2642155 RepID=UPI001D62A040|nr:MULTISPECIES: asparagine synthetase B family protein [unclassified Microcoleus]MCC3469722.1 asparagine synthase [Microcoleus sp. PH2017_06_SFM_O_A]MCC3503491.1 asparagine synthase [Microcoleus sp. PH2017_19_SFW_U_A]TAG96892.1 MAG: asparagine synthase [Oscillatoriales cyanobacterium]MCC3412072.1 asparagine synthase [Microcoleus sp. PH2017_02_FOX_O_A]MCC3470280.1 asparagine synthase [Microcoleus sp. PH2017_13_LAR_U_A]
MVKINKKRQFIGYWGSDSRDKLEALLAKIVSQSATEIPVQKVDNLSSFATTGDENYPIWNVVSTECVSEALEEDRPQHLPTQKSAKTWQIAALSASGLSTYPSSNGLLLPDAWANVRKNCLILGREPFGRVTLYWTQIGQSIWFASSLQLLLNICKKPDISIPSLYGYSCFSYVPTPLTPVENVFAVPAGTELTWECDRESGVILNNPSKCLLEWRESSEKIQDEAEAITQLQNLLKNAVERQISDINSNENVGVFLSGGLDSSVVAALLVKAGVKVRAYTLDFGEAGIPEYPWAQKVADSLNIPLVKVDARPHRIKQVLHSAVKALDLPFGDGVTVPLYLLNEAASQECAIVFNGEGGDQLFAGWTNKPLIAAAVYQAANPAGDQTFALQYLRTFHRLWGYESKVYQPEIYTQIQDLQPQNWLLEALNPSVGASLLHRLRRAGLMLKGAQNIHPRAANLALAFGLKVRSPFCDFALTDWTFQLSGELCLRGACEKYILKRAVENWLPADIVWREKRGMGVPLTSWCFNEFWHDIGDWLNPAVLRSEKHWKPDLAAQIMSGKFAAGIQGRRIGEMIWLLVMWQNWRSQILGKNVKNKSWNHPFWLPRQVWNYRQRWGE